MFPSVAVDWYLVGNIGEATYQDIDSAQSGAIAPSYLGPALSDTGGNVIVTPAADLQVSGESIRCGRVCLY